MPDCSCSHSLHIVPKCQGDSLLGESLLALCCWELGSLASWGVGEGKLGPLGQHPILGWWDMALGFRTHWQTT